MLPASPDGESGLGDRGGQHKWEDEEERRFFEDIQDLRDFVPKSVLGFTETGQVTQDTTDSGSIKDDLDRERREREESEAKEQGASRTESMFFLSFSPYPQPTNACLRKSSS